MPISKSKKKEILEKVSNAVDQATSVVFINFHSLPVADSTSIRKELKGKGINYMVAKKTITKKALEAKKFKGEMPELGGELAIVYGDDNIAPAREIYAFQKKMEERISILGGIFDGRYMNAEEMVGIASIPSIEVLYGQFVNIINSPIAGLVVAINAIADKRG